MRIDEVEPEMVAASDVVDRAGRLLVASGTRLTLPRIRSLARSGISHVEVEGRVRVPGARVDPDAMREAEEELEEVFRHVDRSHPMVKALFAHSVRRRAREKSRK